MGNKLDGCFYYEIEVFHLLKYKYFFQTIINWLTEPLLKKQISWGIVDLW